MTHFPIGIVAVFDATQKKSTVTNPEGKFDLSIFADTDSLYFQHPAFVLTVITKAELVANGALVQLRPDIILMDEFTVVASNLRESAKLLPYKVDVLEAEELKNSNAQTSAEILSNTGNVMVQKSQGGGGSPIIRGFEANKVLLVLDGIRMNNAIYRSGHLQNSITVDNAVLDKLEVVYGPSSTIYGSDALGGVVHYHTHKPDLAIAESNFNFKLNSYLKYATANQAKMAHLNFNLASRKFGSLTAFSVSDFGDIRVGSQRSDAYPADFGLTEHYAVRENGSDVVKNNPESEIQKRTAYRQYNFLQKFLYTPNHALDLGINLQYTTSGNIQRFDKLNDYKNGTLKYADYYYGPQNRLLTAFSIFYKKENSFFTNLKTYLAYQRIDEDRFSRKLGKSKQLQQNEDVSVFSINLDFLKLVNEQNRLNYGIELTHNVLSSSARYENIVDGTVSAAQTRYPDGGSRTYSSALYANYNWLIVPSVTLNAGFRFSFAALHSDFLDKTFLDLPFSEINMQNAAPTGSLSLTLFPTEKLQLDLVASSGFRSPNVDDYGKIRAKNDYITVPNNELKPEYAWNAELGISYSINEAIKIHTSLFSTWLSDAITRKPYAINGETTLLYDDETYTMITNINANKALIKGVSLSIFGEWYFDDSEAPYLGHLKFNSSLNYTHGRDLSNDVPLGHIPPLFGRTSITYNKKRLGLQFSFDYSAAKNKEDFSPFGEDNDAEATPNGYPAWYKLNASLSYELNEYFEVQLMADNILDRYYKSFASGISAAGRNFSFVLRVKI